jgi:hypothetical protein
MVTFEEVRAVAEESLNIVQADRKKQMSLEQRVKLYESLGASSFRPFPEQVQNFEQEVKARGKIAFTDADKVRANLGFLTVEHVLPVWDAFFKGDKEASFVQQMLDLSKKLVQGKVSSLQAHLEINDGFYSDMNIGLACPYPVYSVADAAYELLSSLAYREMESLNKRFPHNDFAVRACDAVSAIDRNEPGAWGRANKEGVQKIEYDLTERYNFWKWWLTDAVPKAWNIIHETN